MLPTNAGCRPNQGVDTLHPDIGVGVDIGCGHPERPAVQFTRLTVSAHEIEASARALCQATALARGYRGNSGFCYTVGTPGVVVKDEEVLATW